MCKKRFKSGGTAHSIYICKCENRDKQIDLQTKRYTYVCQSVSYFCLLRAQSFTSLKADLCHEFLHLTCSLMEHFLEGIGPLRHGYINPNEKSNKYKYYLLRALTEHFLQGNVLLRHLLNAKPPFMSCRRSAFDEVNDCAHNMQVHIHRLIH